MLARILLLSLAATIGCGCAAAFAQTTTIVLTIGAGREYATIGAAVKAANADTNPNDYIDIQVAPGTYTNDFSTVTRALTIEAAPQTSGQVVLKATENLPNEKGIILTFASLTVNGLTFTGAQIVNGLGGNGAGIRDQNAGPGASLTVLNSTFTGNQEAILTGNDAAETITVVNSKFINNGNPNPSYFQHGLYVNTAYSLTVTNSLFCGQLIGHDIKSRAAITTIANNILYDGLANTALGCRAGSSSFAADLPNGGVVTLSANQIIQGAASQNYKLVDYGEEGLVFKENNFLVSNNSFSNIGTQQATGIYDPHCIVAQLHGNNFTGVATIVNPSSCATFQ